MERQAVKEIEELGGWVRYDTRDKVVYVSLCDCEVTNSAITRLNDLTALRELDLSEAQLTNERLSARWDEGKGKLKQNSEIMHKLRETNKYLSDDIKDIFLRRSPSF